jgi:hypothetical protein
MTKKVSVKKRIDVIFRALKVIKSRVPDDGVRQRREKNANDAAAWPAPSSEDTELGVFMEPEVSHGETKVYAGVQA